MKFDFISKKLVNTQGNRFKNFNSYLFDRTYEQLIEYEHHSSLKSI